MKEYYDQGAAEYDGSYGGTGRFAARERPAWRELMDELARTLAALPPAGTLDVACGTGTRPDGARATSPASTRARECRRSRRNDCRRPASSSDGVELPFPDDAFERVTTMHVYGHLEAGERERFVAEAHRVAPELVVVDSALREDVESEEWQERILDDGSRWSVYKRYFTPAGLLTGGRLPHAGRWFVAVSSPR